jgi:hypothetical protein
MHYRTIGPFEAVGEVLLFSVEWPLFAQIGNRKYNFLRDFAAHASSQPIPPTT